MTLERFAIEMFAKLFPLSKHPDARDLAYRINLWNRWVERK